jgi:hypothetical protein
VEELRTANQYQKRVRKKMCCIICVILIVIIAIIAPLLLNRMTSARRLLELEWD